MSTPNDSIRVIACRNWSGRDSKCETNLLCESLNIGQGDAGADWHTWNKRLRQEVVVVEGIQRQALKCQPSADACFHGFGGLSIGSEVPDRHRNSESVFAREEFRANTEGMGKGLERDGRRGAPPGLELGDCRRIESGELSERYLPQVSQFPSKPKPVAVEPARSNSTIGDLEGELVRSVSARLRHRSSLSTAHPGWGVTTLAHNLSRCNTAQNISEVPQRMDVRA